jgi:hypothetical protein
VVLALVLTRTQHGTNRAAISTGSPSRASTPSAPASTVSPSATPSTSFVDPPTVSPNARPAGIIAAPKVLSVGHPLLNVPADWELFAQGLGVVVRIQLALGRITTTPVPSLTSDGPATLLVGSDRVLLPSLDDATGYVVRDGKRAAELPRALQHRYEMLPGPDQRHVWINPTTGDTSGLALVNLDGKPTGVTIDVPADGSVQGSDGAGYALLTGIGGIYDARPGSVHRITTGPLVASGPTRWLAVECDDKLFCADVVIDRKTRARHTLAAAVRYIEPNTGTISPDGRTAALVVPSDGISSSSIQLLDLVTGAVRLTDVVPPSSETQLIRRFVWSPDSRWLFTIDAGGRVIVVNRDSGRATRLGAHLVSLTQLGGIRHRAG